MLSHCKEDELKFYIEKIEQSIRIIFIGQRKLITAMQIV